MKTMVSKTQAPVKNIIFDLGGVLLNIDVKLTANSFEQLGVSNFDALYSQARQKELFDRFEMGKCSADDFKNELRKLIGKNIPSEQIDTAWNSMLLDLPKERIDLLLTLKNTYRLFLLSNTNEIHINRFFSYLNDLYGFSDLSPIFEKEYYSYKIGMRKPNREIFEFVLKENSLSAEETLFIDDSLEHIEGAKKLAIQTHHVCKSQSILEIKF